MACAFCLATNLARFLSPNTNVGGVMLLSVHLEFLSPQSLVLSDGANIMLDHFDGILELGQVFCIRLVCVLMVGVESGIGVVEGEVDVLLTFKDCM